MRSTSTRQNAEPPELVDPAFLLKGLAIVFAAALILAYVTLCIVYSRTQWQLVLHPSRTVATTPAAFALTANEVRFGVDSSGEPQLDGWWIPADGATRTILMLHGSDGNMADSLKMAETLHQLRLNVLIFDYRGYGRSGGDHPSQAKMRDDAHDALRYLLDTRRLPSNSVVVYGHDLGASLALALCEQSNCPALILDEPAGDLRNRISQETRSRAIPASLLFHEDFPLAKPLATSPLPKLLIFHSNNQPPPYARQARDPKTLLSIAPGDEVSLRAGIQRFLDDDPPQS